MEKYLIPKMDFRAIPRMSCYIRLAMVCFRGNTQYDPGSPTMYKNIRGKPIQTVSVLLAVIITLTASCSSIP